MKRTSTAFGLLLALTLLALASPGLAAPPADLPPGTILVTLTSPIMPGGVGMSAPSAFSQTAAEQMTRLVPALASLKKQGHLQDFTLLADANAFRVERPDAQAMLLLRGLPDVRHAASTSTGRCRVDCEKNAFELQLAERHGARDLELCPG